MTSKIFRRDPGIFGRNIGKSTIAGDVVKVRLGANDNDRRGTGNWMYSPKKFEEEYECEFNDEFDTEPYTDARTGVLDVNTKLMPLMKYQPQSNSKSHKGEIMETKSRYEVISELEDKKRNLIRERDGLNDKLIEKQKALKDMERKKADTVQFIDRNIEDIKDDIKNYEATMSERKETIKELITSIDTSLGRFEKLQAKKE